MEPSASVHCVTLRHGLPPIRKTGHLNGYRQGLEVILKMSLSICLAERVFMYPQLNILGITRISNLQFMTSRKLTRIALS